ncbi:RNA cap guanine-N2 methyltransferase-domain-containing protein [Flammula alnicola]|nr:RNA cap guanine-N2 methyltransferase-domain-containing protein [Flammula alnicola]
MGKTKRRGGLSGVSRFVFESMKSNFANSDAANTSPKTSLTPEKKHFDTDEGNPPAKRRKRNDGTAVVEETVHSEIKWVEKYDATGLVPHYSHASQVPDHLQKYFSQRRRFFSLYSTSPGCLLDEEGWYSVTPELLADQIAERCRCDTILDSFCGVGGNAIAFAKTCQRVIALDTSPTRLALARHNAQIYGVADRIEFILTDYISFVKSYLSISSSSGPRLETPHEKRKIDVVFLSPPWGGPSYLSGSTDDVVAQGGKALAPPNSTSAHPSYSLSSIQPVHGAQLFDLTRKITKNVAYYLPRNTRLEEISALLSEEKARSKNSSGNIGSSDEPNLELEEKIEVEEEWMGNKLKALTCYFGGLTAGQEGMF